MKQVRLNKNKSITDFLFFFGLVTLTTSILIFIVTLQNECIFLRNEIYHLNAIHVNHLSRVKVLAGNVNNLSRQDRIEEIALDRFNLHIPTPESLTVYIGEES